MKTTVTERGQISIPAQCQRAMGLEAGQTVRWEQLSNHERRLIILHAEETKPDPFAALGFAKRYVLEEGTTEEWMMILRKEEVKSLCVLEPDL